MERLILLLVLGLIGGGAFLIFRHQSTFSTQLGQHIQADRPPQPPAPGRPNPGGAFGGMTGPQEDLQLVDQFDRDNDKRLNAAERKAARAYLQRERQAGRGPRRPRFRGENNYDSPPGAGIQIKPNEVQSFSEADVYDPGIVRSFFIDFESSDWEQELSDFYHTDVEVPARFTVDGQAFKNVGIHFRGASSFFTVRDGWKRSLNVSLDFAEPDQTWKGRRTLNLLNSHRDPTFLRTVLYYQIAREYIPAPKANYVRVVVNGENWGVFVNAQQVNKDFIRDWFGTDRGARWKVPGSPRGNAGLSYLGEEIEEYKRRYEIKSKDDPAAWAELIRLCRVLTTTPLSELEQSLAPLLDIDGALKFLALENVFINSDGYWIRASDYHLYQDEKGRFHLIPHDANETFRAPEGPGMNLEINGVELDPLAGAEDPNKPLLHRLLAAPSIRARYIRYVSQITSDWLDWAKIGPLAEQYQSLIASEIARDTRKLYPTEHFAKGLTEDMEEQSFRGPRRSISLKSFVEQRRAFLLDYLANSQPSGK